MDFNSYKNLVQKLDRPTSNQIDRFIDMVADDHSWYKHLSSVREDKFIFYIDTNVDKKLVNSSQNELNTTNFFRFQESKVNSYVKNYGHLQYFTTNFTANFTL